jgi:hypothetical protein
MAIYSASGYLARGLERGTYDPLPGDEAAELFVDRIDKSAKILRRERHQGFRLDVLTRR